MNNSENRRIDVWMQHPTERFIENPVFSSLIRWNRDKQGGEMLKMALDPNFTLGILDAGGFACGLLSAWYGPQGALITNDEVHKLCASNPGRFYGLCSADIRDPLKAVKEIRSCILERGFVGVRIVPWLWERCPSDALFYPIYSECAQLGVPICLQVGQTGPMRTSETGRPIPYLERVALDFPDLTIVGGHIGEPWTKEMIFLCTKFQNIYIDTSAYKPSRYPPELVQYMKTNGSKKVMLGSNYPMISHPDITGQLELLELNDEQMKLFCYGNAERVFKLRTASNSFL